MTRTLFAAAAASIAVLSLSGCSMMTAMMPHPAAQAAASPVAAPAAATSTQTDWEAGQIAYLAWNGERRGWATTASGLQYRRDSAAHPEGVRPTATDTVKVHYQGTFIDGREFDSSYARNAPAEFPLNRVIAGWTEGVALMRVGETYHFAIPANLAYGARWVGGEIPPNSTLLFKVELLDVTPAP